MSLTARPLETIVLLFLAAGLAGCIGKDRELPGITTEFEEPRRTLAGPAVEAEDAPPPIAGGTLEATRDSKHVLASDPDRDVIWIVNVATKDATAVPLAAKSEPGRLVEGADGTFYAVLRGGGQIARVSVDAARITALFPVCSAPRGLAFDNKSAELRVTCAGGDLLTLNAADGAELRRKNLGPDLRDIVIDGPNTLVSRFRTAEILVLNSTDTVVRKLTPEDPRFEHATLAWRMRGLPDGGAVLSHQFAQKTNAEVEIEPGGYGGFGCDGPIVGTALTVIRDGVIVSSVLTDPMPVPVDVAWKADPADPTFPTVAVISAGALNQADPAEGFNIGVRGGYVAGFGLTASQITQFNEPSEEPSGEFGAAAEPRPAGDPAPPEFDSDGGVGFGNDGGFENSGLCDFGNEFDWVDDGRQAVALTVLADGTLVTQSRDPWTLRFIPTWSSPAGQAGEGPTEVVLPGEARKDSGHDLFHEESGTGLACASCHGEGGDDGVAWQFAELGALRTQDLRGGVLGTEPFHWGGDQADLDALLNEVMFERMGGPKVPKDFRSALGRWLDRLPRAPQVSGLNPSAIQRGKSVFEASDTGCASCHGDGAATLPASVDVGTGQSLQVPRLAGVGMRAPFMHDGCADTLEARFTDTACGGGEAHGKTAHLTINERADLIQYLKSL